MSLPAAIWLAVFACGVGASVTWHVGNALRDDEVEHVRARVPGGWIYRTIQVREIRGACDPAVSVATHMVFVPDAGDPP